MVHTLASGSSGNALVLSWNGRHLLVDAGISCRRIAQSLGQLGLSPEALLDCTQEIERRMGRTTKSTDGGYKDRIIDIDLIDYDGMTLSTERLTLPHPLMQERNFVLYPLCDVAPEWVHPLFGQTAAEMKSLCRDENRVSPLDIAL